MIATDAKGKLEISLSTDAQTPEDRRPVFVSHVLSSRESARVAKMGEQAGKLEDIDAEEDKVVEAVATVLTGWRNVRDRGGNDVGFDPSRLRDLLTRAELWELFNKIVSTSRLTEQDAKKSASPSGSDTGSSAPAAPPAAA